jgi:hypothetical protein
MVTYTVILNDIRSKSILIYSGGRTLFYTILHNRFGSPRLANKIYPMCSRFKKYKDVLNDKLLSIYKCDGAIIQKGTV